MMLSDLYMHNGLVYMQMFTARMDAGASPGSRMALPSTNKDCFPITAASPHLTQRKRSALNENPTLGDSADFPSPSTGRRRLRSPRDEADVFADVIMAASNNGGNVASQLVARLAQQRRAEQDLEAVLRTQLGIGDVILASFVDTSV